MSDSGLSKIFAENVARTGVRLIRDGLVSANFGNISVRESERFFITRNGSYLEDPGDLVEVPLRGDVPEGASSENRVHREIYLNTGAGAVIHAHPPHSVAISLLMDEVIPLDSEGVMLCPRFPVVSGKPGTTELAAVVAEGCLQASVVLVRGHGTFTIGKTLEDAYILTSIAEHSCRVLWLLLAQGRGKT